MNSDDTKPQKVKIRNENKVGYLVYINKWNGQCVVELEDKTIQIVNFDNLVIVDKKEKTNNGNPLA